MVDEEKGPNSYIILRLYYKTELGRQKKRGTMDQYTKCREKCQEDPEDKEAFELFFQLVDSFMRAIQGKSTCRTKDMRDKSFEFNKMTASTEAYALFVLADKWRVWEANEDGVVGKREPRYTLPPAACTKTKCMSDGGLAMLKKLGMRVVELREKEMNSGRPTLEQRVQLRYKELLGGKKQKKERELLDPKERAELNQSYNDTEFDMDEDMRDAYLGMVGGRGRGQEPEKVPV